MRFNDDSDGLLYGPPCTSKITTAEVDSECITITWQYGSCHVRDNSPESASDEPGQRGVVMQSTIHNSRVLYRWPKKVSHYQMIKKRIQSY